MKRNNSRQRLAGWCLSLLLALNIPADTSDVYKKGTIKIVPDPGFGIKTAWDELFYQGINSIAITPDGKIFITPYMQHKIMVMDKNGNYLESFGQMGQGPGDFVYPGDLAIFNHRYLLVGEYASNMKISLFQFNHHVERIIKTSVPPFDIVPVGEKHIAFVKYNVLNTPNQATTQLSIILKDISTGKETHVTSFEKKEKKTLIRSNLFGEINLATFDHDKILAGYTPSPDLCIYGTNGIRLRSIKLNLEQQPFTSDMKEQYLKDMRTGLKKNPVGRNFLKEINQFQFPDKTPFYDCIFVDTGNNILVFKYGNAFKKINAFQVYNKAGQYICECQFDYNRMYPLFPVYFHQEYVYFKVPAEDSDVYSKIIRARLK